MKNTLTCIICPRSCLIYVYCEDGGIEKIQGALCSKGKRYVQKELTCPMRTISTTVEVTGGEYPLVSVKSEGELPKEQLKLVMRELAKVKVRAPVDIGDILVYNILNTGVNIVATRIVKQK